MQSNTAISHIPKFRRSCSWIYRINKFLMSLNERFNNIILERTIKNQGHFLSDKTRWVHSSVACGSFVAEGKWTEMQLCFHTCSHTYFPIKGIDKCQQQWFLTARFSNQKRRTKFTTVYYVFRPAYRANDCKTTQKPQAQTNLDPRFFPVIFQDPPNEKKMTMNLKNVDSNPY